MEAGSLLASCSVVRVILCNAGFKFAVGQAGGVVAGSSDLSYSVASVFCSCEITTIFPVCPFLTHLVCSVGVE